MGTALSRAVLLPDFQVQSLRNLCRIGSGYVMLDYGHNPDAFRAAADLVASWGRATTAVVGVPGDRHDRVLKEAAHVAAREFDRLVIREDRDLRGRQPGEVAELLRWTALDEVPGRTCRVVLDECDALEQELGFAISCLGATLHVLSPCYGFDLSSMRPNLPAAGQPGKAAEETTGP